MDSYQIFKILLLFTAIPVLIQLRLLLEIQMEPTALQKQTTSQFFHRPLHVLMPTKLFLACLQWFNSLTIALTRREEQLINGIGILVMAVLPMHKTHHTPIQILVSTPLALT